MLLVERISHSHNCKTFSCGSLPDEVKLNNFIQRNARRDNEAGTSETYVLCDDDKIVISYVSIKFGDFDGSHVSVIIKIATNVGEDHKGYGTWLMEEAFRRSKEYNDLTKTLDSVVLVAVPNNENWYAKHFGFRRTTGDADENGRIPMHLPFKEVVKYLETAESHI